MTPAELSTPVLAEDVAGIADILDVLGADDAVRTLREAAHRLDSDTQEAS